MTKLRSLETHFPHIGQAHAPPCVPWHTLARASRPIAGPIPREIRRRHGPCSHLAPMTQLRPWLSLFLLAAAIGCGSTSTSPTDSPDGGEAGTAPPTQFSCPNGRPNTTVDPAVCTAQKVSTFYNCPVSQPPSVCNVTFAYACGLPAGTGPFPVASDGGLDASDDDAKAPEVRYDCTTLCPGVPGACSVSPPTDGGTLVTVFCGSTTCGA